jgi:hypothetical protein
MKDMERGRRMTIRNESRGRIWMKRWGMWMEEDVMRM